MLNCTVKTSPLFFGVMFFVTYFGVLLAGFMSLVRGLVHLHGGSIEAYSRGVGLGSEFVVRLPLAPITPTTPTEEASTDPVAKAPATDRHGVRPTTPDDARA